MEERSRENRLRSLADKQGFAIEKSRAMDSQIPHYGLYRIINSFTGNVEAGCHNLPYEMTLDDVEKFINDPVG